MNKSVTDFSFLFHINFIYINLLLVHMFVYNLKRFKFLFEFIQIRELQHILVKYNKR